MMSGRPKVRPRRYTRATVCRHSASRSAVEGGGAIGATRLLRDVKEDLLARRAPLRLPRGLVKSTVPAGREGGREGEALEDPKCHQGFIS
ncbi:MAG: hypothetical protein AMXMBFR34_33400 [Myxococcaceae bacterium]